MNGCDSIPRIEHSSFSVFYSCLVCSRHGVLSSRLWFDMQWPGWTQRIELQEVHLLSVYVSAQCLWIGCPVPCVKCQSQLLGPRRSQFLFLVPLVVVAMVPLCLMQRSPTWRLLSLRSHTHDPQLHRPSFLQASQSLLRTQQQIEQPRAVLGYEDCYWQLTPWEVRATLDHSLHQPNCLYQDMAWVGGSSVLSRLDTWVTSLPQMVLASSSCTSGIISGGFEEARTGPGEERGAIIALG